MSKVRSIQYYGKQISNLESAIQKLKNQHSRLENTLNNLNMQYEIGHINRQEYLRLFDNYLGHLSHKEWQEYYLTNIRNLSSELILAKQKFNQAKNLKSRKIVGVASALSIILFFISIAGLAIYVGPGLTGAVASSESIIQSNATIEVYFAIAASSNLTDGIEFGSLSPGSVNNNATDNYNSGGSTNTSLNISLSTDSNVNIDFCLAANADLKNATESIGIANLQFANATTTTLAVPALSDARSVSTSYQDSSQNITPGGADHYRFWIDIPVGTTPLRYNNTITFTAVQSGTTCP